MASTDLDRLALLALVEAADLVRHRARSRALRGNRHATSSKRVADYCVRQTAAKIARIADRIMAAASAEPMSDDAARVWRAERAACIQADA
jgi:hypothetical protein